jgi:hypothetical protein
MRQPVQNFMKLAILYFMGGGSKNKLFFLFYDLEDKILFHIYLTVLRLLLKIRVFVVTITCLLKQNFSLAALLFELLFKRWEVHNSLKIIFLLFLYFFYFWAVTNGY